MKSEKRIEPVPPVGWLSMAVLVAVILLVGVVFYGLSKSLNSNRNTLPIPGKGASVAAYLPGEESLTVEEVIERDTRGKFIPLPTEGIESLNHKGGESRWYKFILENRADASRYVVLDTIWKVYDVVDLYQQDSDGSWKATSTGSSVYPWTESASPRWRSFQIMLPAKSTVKVYLYVEDYFRLPSQFVLWPALNDFFNWEKLTYIQFFAYFFTWIVVAAHGTFRYALLKQRDQFYCLLFVFCHGVGTLTGRSVLGMFWTDR